MGGLVVVAVGAVAIVVIVVAASVAISTSEGGLHGAHHGNVLVPTVQLVVSTVAARRGCVCRCLPKLYH